MRTACQPTGRHHTIKNNYVMMKSETQIRIYLLIIIGIFFMSLDSCTKHEEPPNEGQTVLPLELNEGQTVLPQGFIVKPDIYAEEMDATSGWSLIAGASLDLNNLQVHSGTGSLKLTSASGIAATIEKNVKWNLSSDSGKSFRFWVYPHSDPVATIGSFEIRAYSETAYFTQVASGPNLLKQNTWSMIWGNPWKVGSGSPRWSNITKIRLRFYPLSGQVGVISFDLVASGVLRKSAVLITFDDSYLNQFIKAYPIMKAKNMVATSYQISDFVNQPGSHLTSAQLQELYNAGWDIGNHSKTHAHLNTLTQQQVEDELTACKDFLNGLGLTRASSHVAYPLVKMMII